MVVTQPPVFGVTATPSENASTHHPLPPRALLSLKTVIGGYRERVSRLSVLIWSDYI